MPATKYCGVHIRSGQIPLTAPAFRRQTVETYTDFVIARGIPQMIERVFPIQQIYWKVVEGLWDERPLPVFMLHILIFPVARQRSTWDVVEELCSEIGERLKSNLFWSPDGGPIFGGVDLENLDNEIERLSNTNSY